MEIIKILLLSLLKFQNHHQIINKFKLKNEIKKIIQIQTKLLHFS